MSKIANTLFRGSTLRVIQTCINIGIGFWMLPFLITHLGSKDYSLWILIGSVVSSYYFLDLGLSHAVTRYVARYIYTEEYNRANQIINTSLLIYSALAVIVFMAVIFATLFVAPTLVDNSDDLVKVQAVLLISGLSISFEFPSKAFPGIISAYMRFDTIALVRIFASIVNAIAIYFFIGNGYSIIALAVITFLTNIITTGFFVYYTSSLFAHLAIGKKYLSRKDFLEIFHFSKWTFAIDITNLIKSQMGIWLIAAFISAPAVTIYYVAVRLTEYAAQLITQALGITGPIFTKYYAQGSKEKLNSTLIFFVKLYLIAFAIFTSGFIVLGESFIFIWVGDELDYKLAFQCLLILSISRLYLLTTAPFASLLMTLKKHKYTAYLSIIDTAIAILSALYLIPTYGIIGAAIAFALVVTVIRGIALPLIAVRFIDINLISLIYRGLLFLSYSFLITVLFSRYIKDISSWAQLLYFAPLISIFILGGTVLLFDSSEKHEIKYWVSSKFKKKSFKL